MVDTLLSNAYWCIIPMMGPFCVWMTRLTVPIYIGTLVIINTSNVNSTSSFECNSYICTNYTSIGSSVNE
jgi:hypothetical protein